MSLVAIRAALEVALASVSPAIATAWENKNYSPVADTPYQRVFLLPADPVNPEMSQRLTREQGLLQITLAYPLDTGPAAAAARADLIRATFYAGRSFTASGVTVFVDGTPSILPAQIEDDRYVLPVRVRFYAHLTRS
jgi:hypothetical protein